MPFDENLLKRLRENDASLTSIYVHNQNPKLTAEDIEILVDALQTNTYLKCFSIACNDIGDQGAALLAQHTRIIDLDIADNNLSDVGIKALSKLPTLKRLYCANNPNVSIEGIGALIENKNISYLLIDYALNLQVTSPIHIAVYYERLDWIQTLVDHNSLIVNRRNHKGETALLLAATWGHLEIVNWLLQHTCASLLDKSNEQETVLTLAAQHNHLTLVDYFLTHGALALLEKANSQGKTPLICAAEKGGQIMVEYLVEAGANVKAKAQSVCRNSEHKYTALLLAAKNGHLAVVEYLMQYDGVYLW